MFPSFIGLQGEKLAEREVAGALEMSETESHATLVKPIEERDILIGEQKQKIHKLREMEVI